MMSSELRRTVGPIWSQLNWACAITLVGLLLGLAAILAAFRGWPEVAAILLFGCIVCDRTDGAVARRFGQMTPFGAELDNLCDAIAFGVAPAAFIYVFSGGGFMALPAALLVVAGVMRLARYARVGLWVHGGRPHFVGLPIPYTAAVLYCIWPVVRELEEGWRAGVLSVYAVVLAGLMTSRVPVPKNSRVERIGLYVLFPPLFGYYLWRLASGS
jgi:CDP-diacylglycerol--serine O-phosphatidyltransferase